MVSTTKTQIVYCMLSISLLFTCASIDTYSVNIGMIPTLNCSVNLLRQVSSIILFCLPILCDLVFQYHRTMMMFLVLHSSGSVAKLV